MSALGDYYRAQAQEAAMRAQYEPANMAAQRSLLLAQAEAIPQTTSAQTTLAGAQARAVPQQTATQRLAAEASANLAVAQTRSVTSRIPWENSLLRGQGAQAYGQAGLLGAETAARNSDLAPATFSSPGATFTPPAAPRAPIQWDSTEALTPGYIANLPRLAEGTSNAPQPPQGQARQAATQELGPDMVPAMLAPGEAVLNREAAEHVGRGFIEHLNQIGLMKAAQKAQGDPNVGGRPQTSVGSSPQESPVMDQPARKEIANAEANSAATKSPAMGMHADGATTVWPGYASGDANVIAQAQGANGGNMVGLGGGVFNGQFGHWTGNANEQMPTATGYMQPRVTDQHFGNFSSNGGFEPTVSPGSGFNTLNAPRGFAEGGMIPAGLTAGQAQQMPPAEPVDWLTYAKGTNHVGKPAVNVGSQDDGSGKVPKGAAKMLPTMQKDYQTGGDGPVGKKPAVVNTLPPMQNYAAGVEEVRPISAMFPHADATAGMGMTKPQKHAKGTSKVKSGSKPKSAQMTPPISMPGTPSALPPGITSVPVTSAPAMPGGGLMTQWGGGQ